MKLAKKILNFAWYLFRNLILVAVILVTISVISIDKMMPRQLVVVVPILAIVGIALLVALIKWRTDISSAFKSCGKKIAIWVRNNKVKTCIACGIIVACLLLTIPISNWKSQRVLDDSRNHFIVIPTSNVSEKRINLTRIELEKSLREIGSYTKVSVTNPIKVHLYSDTNEFQAATGSPKSVTGLTRWTDQGPEIYIPAELPPNEKGILNEGAPIHELTHAIELFITNNPRSLPLWIREGLANQYQAFWERVLTHIYVWFERDKILSYDRLSLFRYDYPKDKLEKQFFYTNSYEFVRYLFLRYGESTIWGIIQQVGKGVRYESAISNATGRTEKELYQDWLKEWLQGWHLRE